MCVLCVLSYVLYIICIIHIVMCIMYVRHIVIYRILLNRSFLLGIVSPTLELYDQLLKNLVLVLYRFIYVRMYIYKQMYPWLTRPKLHVEAEIIYFICFGIKMHIELLKVQSLSSNIILDLFAISSLLLLFLLYYYIVDCSVPLWLYDEFQTRCFLLTYAVLLLQYVCRIIRGERTICTKAT